MCTARNSSLLRLALNCSLHLPPCRLGHLLQRVLAPARILALTATATLATQRGILDVLGLPASGVLRDSPLRDNLRLRVVHENGGSIGGDGGGFRLRLLALLVAGELREAESVIVYVAFQAQARRRIK